MCAVGPEKPVANCALRAAAEAGAAAGAVVAEDEEPRNTPPKSSVTAVKTAAVAPNISRLCFNTLTPLAGNGRGAG